MLKINADKPESTNEPDEASPLIELSRWMEANGSNAAGKKPKGKFSYRDVPGRLLGLSQKKGK